MLGRTLEAFGRPFRIVVLVALLTAGVVLVPVIALALAPDPPTDLVAAPGVERPVLASLTWAPPARGDVDRYRIEASTSASKPFRVVGETVDTTFSFSDGVGGLPYLFRVKAIDNSGDESSYAETSEPVSALWAENPHVNAGVDTSTCKSCHVNHNASSVLLKGPEAPLEAAGTTGMCLACHDGRVSGAADIKDGPQGFSQPSGHVLEGAETAVADMTNSCASCHPSHGNPVVPVRGTDRCYVCHESDAWYAGEYPAPGKPVKDEAGFPVAGTWPGETIYASSTNAHRLISESTQTITASEVRRAAGDCLYCHSAHGAENPYDGLVGTYRPTSASTLTSDQTTGEYAAACFACHGGVVPQGFEPSFASTVANIKQFATADSANAGHRVKTPGGLLPVGSPMPCYECHGPHGSTRGNKSLISDALGEGLDTGDANGVRHFCFACHTTADTGAGWDSSGSAYVGVADDKVVGLSRYSVLRLPSISGHRETDADSCYTCHGNSYNPGGFNVHNPSTGGASLEQHTATASQECLDCHETADISALHSGCSTCHVNSAYPSLPAGKTAECVSCHNGIDVGTAAYSPADPNHYNETTHTAQDHESSGSFLCSDCHSMGLAEEHRVVRPQGEEAADGTVDCVECHNDDYSKLVIAAGWELNPDPDEEMHACGDCHSDSGLGMSHMERFDSHEALENTSCDGASCHGGIPSVEMESLHWLAQDADGNTSCKVCHTNGADTPLAGSSCGADGTCHTDKTPDHATGVAHAFGASDYNNAIVAGCTNSGAGCHSTETTNSDFTAYHPGSGCTSGACHTSSDKAAFSATFSGNATCADCHNSNFSGAPDVIALASASGSTSGGHYAEAKHAASALDTPVTAGGTASATCASCHGPLDLSGMGQLYNQHQELPGGGITCFDCHNANTAVTAVVTANWPSKQCSECHSLGVLTAMVQHAGAAPATAGSTTDSCLDAGCHVTSDLHALHKDASGCDLQGCHDYGAQATKPTGTTCGTGGVCHNTGDPHPAASHTAAASAECLDCHQSADVSTSHASCTTCHANPDYPTLPAGKSAECLSCHNGSDVGTQPYTPAADNHYNELIHTAPDAPSSGSFWCSDCHEMALAAEHRVVLPQGDESFDGAIDCVECHTDDYAKTVIDAQWALNSGVEHTCADCHNDEGGLGKRHTTRASAHAALENASCDGASCHGGVPTSDIENLHLQAQGEYGNTSCKVCHTDGADTPLAGSSCGADGTCHTDKTPGHAGGTAHAFTPGDYNNATVAGCTNSGAGCHGTETTNSDFTTYHPDSGCTSGACHTSSDKAAFSATYNGDATCADCHDANYAGAPDVIALASASGSAAGGHYAEASHTPSWMFESHVTAGGTASATCDNCHSAFDLSGMGGLHSQHQALPAPYGDTTCVDCHNANDAVSNVVDNGWPGGTCASCHVLDVLPSMVQHGASAPAVAGTSGTYLGMSCVTGGCHATSDLHALHKDAAGGCSLEGCHDFGLQAAKPIATSCGVGSACHTGEPHLHLSTLHDGSGEPMPQPGVTTSSSTATTTVDSQTFPNTTWPAGWTRSSTTFVRLVNTPAGRTHGTYAVEISNTGTTRVTPTPSFYRDYNLSGYTSAQISFWEIVSALSGGTDYARVEYSTDGGTNWTLLRNSTAASPLAQYAYGLPGGGTVRVRFSGNFNTNRTEYAAWDDITVLGMVSSTSTTPLPAGSTAAVSCQNNPNGTECHVVADVAALHSSTPAGCSTCHNMDSTVKNCQTAGCHTPQFINNVDHDTNRHQSVQISTVTGEVFAGTGVTSTTCTGCHDDGIDDEHKVLASYANTPCSICHRKTADSSGPTNVTAANTSAAITRAANTALCTDCHKTSTPSSVHVQRMGTTTTLGSTQFNNTWSGHRSYLTMPGSITTFGGSTLTLPPVASMLTNWSAATESTTMSVSCSDCHGSVTGATGPHGASMAVKMATGYTSDYSSGGTYLDSTAPYIKSAAGTPICAKCHQTANFRSMNNAHSRGNHNGASNGRCVNCHVKTPHAWKRPRLIGYRSDPAAYQSLIVNGISSKSNAAPTQWSSDNCGTTGCGGHNTNPGGTAWP